MSSASIIRVGSGEVSMRLTPNINNPANSIDLKGMRSKYWFIRSIIMGLL